VQTKLSLRAMRRLLKKSGIKRSSEKAKTELRDILETHIIKVSLRSKEFSVHAHRKTIKKQDIMLALKQE